MGARPTYVAQSFEPETEIHGSGNNQNDANKQASQDRMASSQRHDTEANSDAPQCLNYKSASLGQKGNCNKAGYDQSGRQIDEGRVCRQHLQQKNKGYSSNTVSYNTSPAKRDSDQYGGAREGRAPRMMRQEEPPIALDKSINFVR